MTMPNGIHIAELAREIEPPLKTTEVRVEWGVLVIEGPHEESDLLAVQPSTRKTARRFAAGHPNRVVVRRDVAVTTIATPWEKP